MYDTTALKERLNLVDLAERDAHLRRVSGVGEFAGPCPKCGGEDRFHVTATWWFCRQCHEKRGDVIEYIQWRDGLDFAQACDLLGGVESQHNAAPTGNRHIASLPGEPLLSITFTPAQPAIRPTAPPPAAWQERARAFVAWTQGQLWETPAALGYLHGRGLSDDTIRSAGLGWNPRILHDPAARWGLDGDPVYLPVGLVIPCELANEMWYVKIRQPEREPKYLAVRGSILAGALYQAPGPILPDMILTEGELNALSLAQALGPLCSVGSLGAAGNLPGVAAVNVLLRVARIWTRYDEDKAGKAGRDRLGALSARVRALPWPFEDCKDPNDALRAGRDLAAWAVPLVGPRDAAQRAAWLRGLLDVLDEAAFAASGDGMTPRARLWQACYGAFERLGWGDGVSAAESAA